MSILSKTLSAGAVAVAGATAWSRFLVDHDLPLDDPVPASATQMLAGPDGVFAMYSAGLEHDSTPVLLVHSVNAAASAYEMRPLFIASAEERPTYAVDLPGFGHSSRDRRAAHSPESMAAALTVALRAVGPAHVVALSLGSEFAARAAIEVPDLTESLTLISPTGLSSRSTVDSLPMLRRLIDLPVLGQAAFDLLVTKPSIRWFLDKSFAGTPDPGLVEYAYATAHQPGARHAPGAFVSGALFTPDAATRLYAHAPCPVLILYDRDPYSSFQRLPELIDRNPSVSAIRIEGSCGLPHFEQLGPVLDAIGDFWRPVP